MKPVMYRKANELEEPDEDGVDRSGPFPCLRQVPRILPTPASVRPSCTARGQHRARRAGSHTGVSCAACIPSTNRCLQSNSHHHHFKQPFKKLP